jgi:hypothetical protein
VFRPHFRTTFGFFVGYPVPYLYPYPYEVPVYGYAVPGPVTVVPGPTTYGGVTFEVSPSDTAVYVDDTYAGTVDTFDGTTEPLTLAAGTHRIELQADGYEPLTFDVIVQAGQVIPYRGDLQPIG